MSALGSISARRSTMAVGWIGMRRGPSVLLVVAGERLLWHGIAGDTILLAGPRGQIQHAAAVGAERAVRVIVPRRHPPARRTWSGAHGSILAPGWVCCHPLAGGRLGGGYVRLGGL